MSDPGPKQALVCYPSAISGAEVWENFSMAKAKFRGWDADGA
jgi:hypothetical protein